MKIFGHPMHMMLIHFPSALLPMDLACSVIYLFTKDVTFTNASYYSMCGGVALGWMAIIFGLFDLLNIFKSKPEAMRKALLHGGINSAVIIAYSVLAFLQYRNYPKLEPDGSSMVAIKFIIITFMIVGNYLGGSLILKDRVV
jgi:uncharacterized membrane protein